MKMLSKKIQRNMRNQILERMIAMAKKQRYLAELYANGARTVIKALKEGKDGFFCRDVKKELLVTTSKIIKVSIYYKKNKCYNEKKSEEK